MEKQQKIKTRKLVKNSHLKEMHGITLIALVVTIVLNCSFLAMVVKS